MMRRYLSIILAIFFLSLPSVVFSATYYISTGGDNGNPGTIGSPWATLIYANSQMSNGDTVYMRGGTYEWASTDLTTAGITVAAHSGETPIIDGTNGTAYTGLLDITASNITVDGLTLRNHERGILVQTGTGVTVRNCTIYDIWHNGIILYETGSLNALIEYNTVYNTAQDNTYRLGVFSGFWSGGIAVRNSSDITIRGNDVHQVFGEGIIITHIAGGGVTPSNITIEYNLVYECWAVEIYVDGCNNSIVRYNLVYGTSDTTYWKRAWSYDPTRRHPSAGILYATEIGGSYSNAAIYGNLTAGNIKNIQFSSGNYSSVIIYNNTLIEAVPGTLDYGDDVAIGMALSGANYTVRNNIVWQNYEEPASFPSGVNTDYNLWNKTPDTDAQGANDPSYAVPLTTKTTGWNSLTSGELDGSEFELQSESPAIDVGVNLGASYDDAILPDSTWPDSVTTGDQDDYGDGWEIGAFIYDAESAFPAVGSNITISNGVLQ